MKKFTLTKEQTTKVNDWLHNTVYPEVINQQKSNIKNPMQFHLDCWDMGYPYDGAIGGGLTYCFTETSLGIIETVYYGLGTNMERKLELTDFSHW